MTASLTPRDKGELLSCSPPLRNFDLAVRLKRYWFEGRTAKHAAIITDCKKRYAEKFYVCFSRALRRPDATPTPIGDSRKRPKSLPKIAKKQKTIKAEKTTNPLTVNFSTPLSPIHYLENKREGVRGVTWIERDKRWRAQIKANGKVKYLGQFVSIKDAEQAFKNAKQCQYLNF